MFRTLRRYQWVTDVSIAAAFFLAQFAGIFSVRRGFDAGMSLLLFSVALGLRRASPGIALALCWVAAIVQMAAFSDAPQFSDLAVLAVVFTTARYGGTVVRWVGFGSAVLGSIVATAYLMLQSRSVTAFLSGYYALNDSSLSPLPLPQFALSVGATFLGCLAVLGLSWTLGVLTWTVRRAREIQLAKTEAEQEVVVEQERNRIARDMHDVVAHSLAVVIAQADGARYARASDPEAVDVALTTISTTAREALGDVRILLGQLRHRQRETPLAMLVDLDALVDQLRSSGLVVSRETVGEDRPLATAQQLAVYRITQEALTNALRHGDTEREVRLIFAWKADALRLVISSAVSDLRAVDDAHPGGHGLAGMRERAALVGGTFAAGVDDGRWIVTATIPLGLEAMRL